MSRWFAKRGHAAEHSEEAVAVAVQAGSGHRLEDWPSASVVTALDA